MYPIHTLKLFFIDCDIINVGSSNAKTLIVKNTITEHTCPIVVNKDNWLGGSTSGDTFSVQKRRNEEGGTDILVTRTDGPKHGWEMDLRFQCCRGKVFHMKHSNAFVLKFVIVQI